MNHDRDQPGAGRPKLTPAQRAAAMKECIDDLEGLSAGYHLVLTVVERIPNPSEAEKLLRAKLVDLTQKLDDTLDGLRP